MEENAIRSAKELEKKIEQYNAQIEEWKEENEKEWENAIFYYENSVKIFEYELKDAKTLEHYKDNLGKAVKVMHKISEAVDNESITDDQYSDLIKKVRHHIGKEELRINLKIKALEAELGEVNKMECAMMYTGADMWFNRVSDLVVGEE